ncbi:MAG: hypothetical protein ACOCQX_01180 [Candidatus Nanoarchaeia archaeon]
MGIFSFFKKEQAQRCDWCNDVLRHPVHIKRLGNQNYSFCSQSCKKSFRNAGMGKPKTSCPTCAIGK